MLEKTADLHIHSYYSDGTMSPEEILKEALQNNVGLIALTDHDMLDGSRELRSLCQNADIKLLTGVELNSLYEGLNYHILGYGVDIDNPDFQAFVEKNRSMLFRVNSLLIEKMEKDYPSISVAEYNDYQYDRTKGGWKALHYLMEKGFTNTLREGFALYTKYNCYYDCVDFPSIQTVCDQIHMAGGKAILAHPGVSIKTNNHAEFKQKIQQLLSHDLDGIECYYVTHSKEITNHCLSLCNQRGLMITCGSDCHGTFGTASIGDVNIPIRMLNLGTLEL